MVTQLENLKNEKRWVCWNYRMVGGKKTKKPCTPSGKVTGTSTEYAGTWVTHPQAMAGCSVNGHDGVGFVLSEGMFFLDIDHRAVDDPMVQEMLSRFASYTEYSVSGNGIHIYGHCDLNRIPTYIDDKGSLKLDRRYYMKNPHNDMELYIGKLTNRFAVFTGDVIVDAPLQDCTNALLMTLDSHMRRTEQNVDATATLADVDTDQIIRDLHNQRNSGKFSLLFDYGDTSDYGGDDSAADCALCAMIAFRTGNNPDAIDTIFRQSALMRDKWERDDYREMTIQAAVEACHGVFHHSVMPVPAFIQVDPRSGKEYVSVPLLAKYVREHLQYKFVRDNATGATLKYVYEHGCYKLYSDDMFKGLIKRYIADYNEMLVKMGQVNEVYQNLLTDLHTLKFSDFNADEDIVNFRNGLLRLSDLQLLPHNPNIVSTIQLDAVWHGRPTPTPVFDLYMNYLTDGRRDDMRVLQEFQGATFSNVKGWRMKKALFNVGPGDTGKSQLKGLTERILGKGNYIGIDLTEIEARFGTGNLYGKRLAGSSDMSFVTISELKTFKKCTGGDSLFAEFKGMNGFEFTYNGLLWFCMNRLPKFGGDDGEWVYNRIIPIHCNHVIPAEQQDKHLLDKMYAERDGIVYKAIMAFREVIENGYRFSEPQSVIDARKEYRYNNNTVIAFFQENMVERTGKKIQDSCTTGRVYKVYKAWCADNNNGYARTAKEFRDTLSAHLESTFGEMTVQRKQGTFYRDYTLTEEAKQQYQREYGYDEVLFSA